MLPLLTLIILLLILLYIIKLWRSYQNPAWCNIPGPSHSLPFIGHYVAIKRGNTSELHSKWTKEYGPIMRYYSFGNVVVVVSDPSLLKYILLNNHLFDKDIIHYRLLGGAIGNGLVTQVNEELHKHHRAIISPAFAHKHLKALVPIFQSKARFLVEDWTKRAKEAKREPVPIKDDIAKATADVIGEAAFGYQLNSQRDNSSSSIYSIFATLSKVGFNLFLLIPGIQLLFPTYYLLRDTVKALTTQVETIIAKKEERRKEKRERGESEEVRDLLDVLMDSEGEDGQRFTRSELAAHTQTFLLAGYETSSVCILWTMYLLARHPDIQRRLAEEIINVIGKDRAPTAEDIDQMPYLFQVLRESLRICPPIPYVLRHVAEDVTLGDYLVPKGTLININIYHQHHNSPVWKDHEIFDPERWTSADMETSLFGSYIPFILGPRNCIGSKFAMLEVRVLLAMIIQKLKFEPEQGQEEVGRTITNVVMVPRTPVKLLFQERL